MIAQIGFFVLIPLFVVIPFLLSFRAKRGISVSAGAARTGSLASLVMTNKNEKLNEAGS